MTIGSAALPLVRADLEKRVMSVPTATPATGRSMEIRETPLVDMAGEAKRPSHWLLAWVIAAVAIIGGSGLGDVIGSAILGNPGKTDTLYQFNEIFVFGGTLLLLFLWVRVKEGRRFSSIGFRGSNPVGKLILGSLIGAAMMSIAVLAAWGFGQYATGQSQHTNLGTAALVAIVPLILVFFFQASTEEAVTRGYMLQVAGRQINAWVAILGSSIFFAVLHTDFRPIVLLNITLCAVFACFVALRQGNLWLIAGIHAGWNYFQGNFFGLPVSGNAEASSLFAFGPAKGSSELLTGGDFGVEASIVGTAVLAVALIAAYVSFRRQQAARASEASLSAA